MGDIGIMRAIFEAIDVRTNSCKVLVNMLVQGVNGLLIVISAGHTGLIGDHKDEIAPVIR